MGDKLTWTLDPLQWDNPVALLNFMQLNDHWSPTAKATILRNLSWQKTTHLPFILDHLMDKTVYDAQVNKSPVNKTG